MQQGLKIGHEKLLIVVTRRWKKGSMMIVFQNCCMFIHESEC